MIHKLGGIVVGIAIALVTMMLAEALGYRLFGFSLGPDEAPPLPDTALPPGVQLAVVAGWLFGTFFGAYAAWWVSLRRWTVWPVAAAILLAVAIRVILSATPPLMIAGGILGPLLAAAAAQRLPGRRGPIS